MVYQWNEAFDWIGLDWIESRYICSFDPTVMTDDKEYRCQKPDCFDCGCCPGLDQLISHTTPQLIVGDGIRDLGFGIYLGFVK